MTPLVLISVIIAGILLSVILIGIMEFGILIAKTPDMLDRHGKRKEQTNKPAKHAVMYADAFALLYIVGAITTLISESTSLIIVGGVIILSVLVFAVTILYYEMEIYNLMKKNEVELNGSLVA